MKNKFFIIAIILLVISIAVTPFIFKVMNNHEEIPETTAITEIITEPTEITVDVPETTTETKAEETTEATTEATEVTTEPTIAPTTPEETEPVTEPAVEATEETIVEETTPKAIINDVPLYNQWNYPDVYYGERPNVTVATHGDGMTTFAMIATYLKDDPTLTPDVIANMFGHYDSEQGTSWTLFTEGAKELELGEVKQVWDWNVGEIEKSLRNGSVVACCVVNSPFSEKGGHYILMTGITEDGKIMVHDSNGYNYDSPFLKPMFKNGFDPKHIYNCAKSYWIYEPKNAE